MQELITKIIAKSQNRFTFCIDLINELKLENIAELGVYKGDFAKKILENSPLIKNYTMIDPWRNLSGWNKPANKDNDTFNEFYKETLLKTDFAKEKRHILRGKTTEVIDQIDDDTYDFVYIDGDHTLKGITIDLINLWPKVKKNGFVLGDDFSASIWQHSQDFEPTMVFPFAVYFAEAVNTKIYSLPYDQFLITKGQTGFEFIDMTREKKYANSELRTQLLKKSKSGFKSLIKNKIPFASKIYTVLKK
ncbi:class I SAM-dependent methyltransferase [Psychroserpens mesophilus]|uniref:class I SAM-dependent methyltransferase n=1 Tax=Psychroserpens mesophilus TaxID=325473 RepID=UPI003D66055E